MGYGRLNAEELNQRIEGFNLPAERVRQNLKAHDRALLWFEPDGGPPEAMWLRVCGPAAPSSGFDYVGQVIGVANELVTHSEELPRTGEVVYFSARHVAGFETELGAPN